MCPQLTNIDVMNAIHNMTSSTAIVYKDDSKRISFSIQLCCGVNGAPHISCSYIIGCTNTCFTSDSVNIPECIEKFNRDVRSYYESNWYRFQ